jgi:hypothetical protein
MLKIQKSTEQENEKESEVKSMHLHFFLHVAGLLLHHRRKIAGRK